MPSVRRIIRNILHDRTMILKYANEAGLLRWMPDEQWIRLFWKIKMGYPIDLDNPKTFNEKLQWLKLYDRRPEYTVMVDKYKVREYIAQELGEEYLIPLLGVWDHPDEIDFDLLPDKFVLKCNHNSGRGMVICKDKSRLDIEKVKNGLREGLREDYFYVGREWPYKNVPKKIICEQYMKDSETDELADFKIHCFNGKPRFILVCSGRFKEGGLHEDFYSPQWEKLEVKRPYVPTGPLMPKPDKLDEMLMLSRKLAKDYPFMRTDFYCVDGRIYFGEITMFPAGGMNPFEPNNWDETFGNWILLPMDKDALVGG